MVLLKYSSLNQKLKELFVDLVIYITVLFNFVNKLFRQNCKQMHYHWNETDKILKIIQLII